jgi:hypothetical protein
VDEPLVLLDTDDIEQTRLELLESGAELGAAPVTNGDPATGIVDVPGARLAVVQLATGTARPAPDTAWAW